MFHKFTYYNHTQSNEKSKQKIMNFLRIDTMVKKYKNKSKRNKKNDVSRTEINKISVRHILILGRNDASFLKRMERKVGHTFQNLLIKSSFSYGIKWKINREKKAKLYRQ